MSKTTRIFLISVVVAIILVSTFMLLNKIFHLLNPSAIKEKTNVYYDLHRSERTLELKKKRREEYLNKFISALKKDIDSGLYSESRIFYFFNQYRTRQSDAFKIKNINKLNIAEVEKRMYAEIADNFIYLLFPVGPNTQQYAWIWDYTNSKFHAITKDRPLKKQERLNYPQSFSSLKRMTDEIDSGFPPTSKMLEKYKELTSRTPETWSKILLKRANHLNDAGKYPEAMEVAGRAIRPLLFSSSKTKRTSTQSNAALLAALLASKLKMPKRVWEYISALPLPLKSALPEIRTNKPLIELLTTNKQFRNRAIYNAEIFDTKEYSVNDTSSVFFNATDGPARIQYETKTIQCDPDTDSCEGVKDIISKLVLFVDSLEHKPIKIILKHDVVDPTELRFRNIFPVSYARYANNKLFVSFYGESFEVDLKKNNLIKLCEADSLFCDSKNLPLLITKRTKHKNGDRAWRLTKYFDQKNKQEVCLKEIKPDQSLAIDGFWYIKQKSVEDFILTDSLTERKVPIQTIECPKPKD